jgi:DNA-directed RNA polymerase subunit E'/Rpb7
MTRLDRSRFNPFRFNLLSRRFTAFLLSTRMRRSTDTTVARISSTSKRFRNDATTFNIDRTSTYRFRIITLKTNGSAQGATTISVTRHFLLKGKIFYTINIFKFLF